MSPGSALRHVKERTPQALKALESEMPNRPVVMTRSPSWHRYNVVGQTPHIVKGDAIQANTFLAEGMTLDHDGDTASIHVPSSKEAVADVRDKMMVSKMIWSIKDRSKVLAAPKHEQLIGLSMGYDKGGQKRKFKTDDEAMKAIEDGQIDLNDDIEIEP
jgi:DNA-directed RNA polymerase beta' subunit